MDLERVRKTYKASSGFVYKVFYEQLDVKLRERKGAPWPEVVGIDEHFFTRQKGFTEFVTVLTDLKKRELFEMAKGKATASLIEQLAAIPGRENVKVVVMDLSSPDRRLVMPGF